MSMLRISTWCLVCCCTPAAFAQLFIENFDDGNASARWSSPIVTLENPALAFDGSVDYAYDYSVVGAPSAPNSEGGTTLGVAFETNTTDDGDVNEGESVGIVPLSSLATFPTDGSDFTLTADVYLFWNSGSGSTEYGTLGVFSGGTEVPFRFNTNPGDGVSWQWDSDGDSGTDLLRYEGPFGFETGLGEYEDIPFGSIPNVNTGEPGVDFPGNEILGPANQWVEMGIASRDGMVSFSMNGYVIDTFDNSGGDFQGGTLLIGGSDPFNSVNLDNGSNLSNVQIFDNILLRLGGDELSADFNGDGSVDGDDFLIWQQNFPTASGATMATGDANGDGIVDGDDFLLWQTQFGSGAASGEAAQGIPEPTAIITALVCLAASVLRRKTF